MKTFISLIVNLLLVTTLAQKEYVVQTIPYNVADSWTIEIRLSPGFLTEVNFPAPIRVPGSGDFGMYELIGKSGDTSVWLRPKQFFTATDLWVPMENGKTAIFYITYDDKTKISRKYVPADTVTERQANQSDSTAETTRQSLPSWVHFNYDATLQDDNLIIAYSLQNNGLHPLVNDHLRLRVLADGNSLPYDFNTDNHQNRLMSGESEDGSLFVENLPKGLKNVTLEWVLIAQGVAEFYTVYETVAIQ
jgi:hypothetical protein